MDDTVIMPEETDLLSRSVEQWYVGEIVRRAPAIVTEPQATAQLMDRMPSANASKRAWQAYCDFLLEGIGDAVQISYSPDVERISLAEGNHRLKIIYDNIIVPGKLPDFEVKVNAKVVDPIDIGDLTMERASGKQQALHFRFLMDLNFQLGHMLQGLGYETQDFDEHDFSLLESLLLRLRNREVQGHVTSDRTRVQGPFNDLYWNSEAHLFDPDTGRLVPNLEAKVERIIANPPEGPDDLVRVVNIGRELPDEPKAIFKAAVKGHLNREAMYAKISGADSPAMSKYQIAGLLGTAVKRALFERVVNRIDEKIQAWVDKGSVTYASVSGYAGILQRMATGAQEAGIPLRELVETLGGQRFGNDTRSYSPIEEAYRRITEISEPFRTRLVTHVLEVTSHLHESRKHRRGLIDTINQGLTSYTGTVEQYVQSLVDRDMQDMYLFAGLASAGRTHASTVKAARKVAGLIGRSEDPLDDKSAATLVNHIVTVEREDTTRTHNVFSTRLLEARTIDDLTATYLQESARSADAVEANETLDVSGQPLDPNLVARLPSIIVPDSSDSEIRPSWQNLIWQLPNSGRGYTFVHHTKEAPKKSILFDQGNQGKHVFAVYDGTVKHSWEDSQGNRIILDRSTNTHQFLIGLESMVGLPYAISAIAEGKVKYVKMNRAQFQEVLESDTVFAKNVLYQATRGALHYAQRTGSVAFSEVRTRFADYLIRTAHEANSTMIKVTRQDIAADIGCSREMVGRIVSEFSQRRMILAVGKTFFLTKPEEIADVAVYGPRYLKK